jgi:Tetratricopeptide repeat
MLQPNRVEILLQIGSQLRDLKEYPQALDILEHGLTLAENTAGPQSMVVSAYCGEIAVTFWMGKDFASAVRFQQRALQIVRDELKDAKHPTVQRAQRRLQLLKEDAAGHSATASSASEAGNSNSVKESATPSSTAASVSVSASSSSAAATSASSVTGEQQSEGEIAPISTEHLQTVHMGSRSNLYARVRGHSGSLFGKSRPAGLLRGGGRHF